MIRGSGKPYLANVKLVLVQCTFSQSIYTHHHCSAQGQVLHSKLRHNG